ncbi:MAG TPA: HAD hydrolase family protein [Candidatus Polarisedimenticolia bacterium]|nr:HAD hydrolase family protein [Candidatus Polarisedimenticolia bacterium]
MRCRTPLRPRARRIALLLMDVDGVMTDGGISFIDSDREARTFDAQDGVGLWIARRAGLRTGLLSGRSSGAVLRRAEELRIDEVHLKVRDKRQAYLRILRRLRLSDAQVCYIGDDLVDLPVLLRVGMPVAVADAHPEVLRRVRFVTRAAGGRGAIREVIDAILKAQGKWAEVLAWFDDPENGGAPGTRRSAGERRSR